MNRTSQPSWKSVFPGPRLFALLLLFVLVEQSASAAVIDAHWTGGGGTSSYVDPANWDIGQTPLDNATNQFNVFIPTGASVAFDPFSAGGSVRGFSLGIDATFAVSPGRAFNVTGLTLIDGVVQSVDSSFSSPTGATSFPGGSARLSALNGVISVPAKTYSITRFAHETALSVSGADGLLDLSALTTLTYGPTSGRWGKSMSATANGRIDLSGLTSLSVNPGEDDVLDISYEAGGRIDLSNLQSINGLVGNGNELVRFYYESGQTYDLPSLESARTTQFFLRTNSTVNAPEMLNLHNGYVEQASGSEFNAPKLADVQESLLLITEGTAFNSAPLMQIDNARIAVESNATFSKVAAGSYSNTRYAHETIFSSTGAGAVLDLSSLTSLTFGPNSGRWGKTLTATGGGRIDLSNVTSLSVRPGEDDVLDLNVDGGGLIDWTKLATINSLGGNGSELVRFYYEGNRTFDLPALESARTTQLFLRTNTTLNAPKLASLQSGYIEQAPGSHFNAPLLNDVQDSSILVTEGAGFNSAELIEIDNARFAVESNATMDRVATGSYANTRYAHETIFSATGANALLDLSSLTSVTFGPNSGRWGKTITATGGGKVDLSNVTSLSVRPGEDDVLDVIVSGGGNVDLAKLSAINGLGGNGNELVRFFYEGNRTFELPALISATSTQFYLPEDAALNAPNLKSVHGGHFDLSAGSSVNAPQLKDIQNTSITLRPGAALASPPLEHVDDSRFLVEGAVFDLVSSSSYANTRSAQEVIFGATGSDAVLNLSGVHSLTIGGGGYIKTISATAGGRVDLSGVTNIQVPADQYGYLDVSVSGGGEVDLASLESIATGPGVPQMRFFYEGSRDHELPSLRTARATQLWLASDSTLNAPSLKEFRGGLIDLSTGATLNAPMLSSLDDTRINAQGDASFVNASILNYTNRNYYYETIFSASGSNASISLPAVRTLTIGGGGYTKTIQAAGDGRVDLSAVTSIQVPVGEYGYLDFSTSGGGVIDLASLKSIAPGGGIPNVRFLYEGNRDYELAALTSARSTQFWLAAGTTFDAPALKELRTSLVDITTGSQFNAPELSIFDDSRISVHADVTFANAKLTSYTNTANAYDTIFAASGANAVLELPSLRTLTIGGGGYTKTIVASQGGRIDLSGVTSIQTPPAQYGYLSVTAESGGVVDLSNLRSISANQSYDQRVWFYVEEGAKLKFGDLAVAEHTEIYLRNITSEMEVNGSLFLDATSRFSMVEGARLSIAGDLLFRGDTEDQFVFDRGLVQLNGSTMQYIEAGGEDLGVSGPLSGNFGIGRLEVGREELPTTVQVLDLFNNGNRAEHRYEAIYLFGLGGLDGLSISEGSTFVLNDVNVYAWLDGEMKHLNELFGDEILAVPFGAGTLALTDMMPGDTNGDWRVNIVDMNAVRNNFGQGGFGVEGDANRDGIVNLLDFNDVRNNFGRVAMSNANAVPEPGAMSLLLVVGAVGGICLATRRSGRPAVAS